MKVNILFVHIFSRVFKLTNSPNHWNNLFDFEFIRSEYRLCNVAYIVWTAYVSLQFVNIEIRSTHVTFGTNNLAKAVSIPNIGLRVFTKGLIIHLHCLMSIFSSIIDVTDVNK